MQSRHVFSRNKMIFYHCSRQENQDRAIKWHSEPSFTGFLHIRQEILMFSWIAEAFHGTRPPFFIQTWLQHCRRCPFLNFAQWSFCGRLVPVLDLQTNVLIWRLFKPTTTNASVHLGPNYNDNLDVHKKHQLRRAQEFVRFPEKIDTGTWSRNSECIHD